jgi:hypothetical protein
MVAWSGTALPVGSITINGIGFEQRTNKKFLGIYLDDTLLGDSHTGRLSRQLGFAVATVSKAKSLLVTQHLLLIYHAFLSSYLHYGIKVYFLNHLYLLRPLYKISEILRIL